MHCGKSKSQKEEGEVDYKAGEGLRQLLMTGVKSFTIILALVALILSSFEYNFFSTWVVFVFMCGVPVQLVMTMQMEMNYPRCIGRMSQPGKGIIMTIFTIVVAMTVASLLFYIVGHGVGPPQPMLIMYTIMSVVVTFWFIPVMDSWPLSKLTSHPLILGVGSLVVSYSLALFLFRVLFDFSFMRESPAYVELLDPKGSLMAWTAISFFVTTNAAMLLLLLTEKTIVSQFLKNPRQPMLGMLSTGFILVVGLLCYGFFVGILNLDRAVYMVRVPVCYIFGVFLVDPLMQHQIFDRMQQPVRGLCLSALAVLFAFVMYYFYAAFAPLLTGVDLLSGWPGYDLELWIANALLGITFPVIVIVAKFFDFWPVKRIT